MYCIIVRYYIKRTIRYFYENAQLFGPWWLVKFKKETCVYNSSPLGIVNEWPNIKNSRWTAKLDFKQITNSR